MKKLKLLKRECILLIIGFLGLNSLNALAQNVQNCKAYFYDDTTGTTGLVYKFYNVPEAGANNITNWSWNFGDSSTTSTVENPTHQFAKAGQYNVCLTVSVDSNGIVVCTNTFCREIYVKSTPPQINCQAYFYYDTTVTNAGLVYNFIDKSQANNITNWLWDFGDSTTSTSENPTHHYAKSGIYNICLTISSTAGGVVCNNTFCREIYAGNNPPPYDCEAYFYDYPDSTGLVYNFNDESQGSEGNNITRWLWSFGDNTTSSEENPVHQFAQAGTYTVCLTISSTAEGFVCTNTFCREIYVLDNLPQYTCKAYFYYDEDSTSTNPGLTYSFYGELEGNNNIKSWSWNFGDGTTSTVADPVHTFANSGIYNVCLTASLTVEGTVVCTNTFCRSVDLLNNVPQHKCQAYFFYDTIGSTGLVYKFPNYSKGNNITNFSWNFGDNTTDTGKTPIHQFAQGGTYCVCLTISSVAGDSVLCSNTFCRTMTVTNNLQPINCQAYFYYDTAGTGLVYKFYDVPGAGANYITSWSWNFGDSTTSTEQNPVHTYAQAGEYYVCLTISAATGNTLLCTNTYCRTLYIGNNLPRNCSAHFGIYPTDSLHIYYLVSMATGVKPIKYSWSWGDGSYDTSAFPTHSYKTAEFYTICLTITDAAGCKSIYCVFDLLKSNNPIIRISVIPYGSNPEGINELNSIKDYSQIYPDPVNNTANISVNLNAHADIKLDILDYIGQLVFSSVYNLNAGSNIITINTTGLSKGLYLVRMSQNNNVTNRKFVKLN